MDLGMMHLFGGFDAQLFDTYHDFYPLEQGGGNAELNTISSIHYWYI